MINPLDDLLFNYVFTVWVEFLSNNTERVVNFYSGVFVNLIAVVFRIVQRAHLLKWSIVATF